MTRIALLDALGNVANVIVADPDIGAEIAAAQGLTAREIVTEDETPITRDAIVSRSCEPSGRLERGVFVPAPRAPERSLIDEARAVLESAASGDGADAERAQRALAELGNDTARSGR